MKVAAILLMLGAFHGAFLAGVILSKGRGRAAANNCLAAILLIFSGYLFENVLLLEGLLPGFPHLQAAFVPLFFLLGPLYYHYVRAMLEPRASLRPGDLLHLIPAVVCFLTILPFYLQPAGYKAALIHDLDPEQFSLSPSRALYYGSFLLHSALYTARARHLLRRNRTDGDRRSRTNAAAVRRWLTSSTAGYAAFLAAFMVVYLLFLFSDFYLFYVRIALLLVAAFLMHLVGYWTARASVIVPEGGEKDRYRGSALTSSGAEGLKKELLRLMDEEKAYRAGDLSLGAVSERLSTNAQYLSQLVNQAFGCSFTDFVNAYRVDEARALLRDRRYDHWSLDGIALEVGFNHKNTFTRAFKRHVGQTPSAYRKS